jgi:hypothetical protein
VAAYSAQGTTREGTIEDALQDCGKGGVASLPTEIRRAASGFVSDPAAYR